MRLEVVLEHKGEMIFELQWHIDGVPAGQLAKIMPEGPLNGEYEANYTMTLGPKATGAMLQAEHHYTKTYSSSTLFRWVGLN